MENRLLPPACFLTKCVPVSMPVLLRFTTAPLLRLPLAQVRDDIDHKAYMPAAWRVDAYLQVSSKLHTWLLLGGIGLVMLTAHMATRLCRARMHHACYSARQRPPSSLGRYLPTYLCRRCTIMCFCCRLAMAGRPRRRGRRRRRGPGPGVTAAAPL